jgi:penicillin-binding protein 2
VFGSYPIAIAGKTGTAEKVVTLPGFQGLMDQSWWCGYAPAEGTPTIAVCAIIENGGHGGTAAAPAALKVFEQYYHLPGVYVPPERSD